MLWKEFLSYLKGRKHRYSVESYRRLWGRWRAGGDRAFLYCVCLNVACPYFAYCHVLFCLSLKIDKAISDEKGALDLKETKSRIEIKIFPQAAWWNLSFVTEIIMGSDMVWYLQWSSLEVINTKSRENSRTQFISKLYTAVKLAFVQREGWSNYTWHIYVKCPNNLIKYGHCIFIYLR